MVERGDLGDNRAADSPTTDKQDSHEAVLFADAYPTRPGRVAEKPGIGTGGDGREGRTPDDRATHLEKEYGVHLVQNHGKLEYHLQNCGQDQILFKTDNSVEGLKSGDRTLQQMIQQKEQDLSTKYEVHFSVDGDHVKSPKGDGTMVQTRQPRLDELLGIEMALRHSKPSQYLSDAAGGEGIKINFLRQKTEGAAAYVWNDGSGKNQVYVEPPGDRYAATEEDAKLYAKNTGDSILIKNSLEAVLTHEFGHNMQTKMGWDNNPAKAHQMAVDLGWHGFTNEKNETEYMIEDKHGNFYRAFKQDHFRPSTWFRCDNNGHPLDASGHPTDRQHSLHVSSADMVGQAKVRPNSDYYPSPVEEFAEGIKDFRLGASSRASLIHDCPDLYNVIRREDQLEIDNKYGQGRYIRLPDGSITANTKDARKAVQDFEQGYAKH